jgi:hypothetical protein
MSLPQFGTDEWFEHHNYYGMIVKIQDNDGKRWTAYKAGRIPTVSYEEVMAKHR